jgi:ketopantoate reductase
MRVVIVGAGAVGAVIGTSLAQAGHEVCFWLRPERRAQLTALSVERAGKRITISPRWLSAGDAVPDSDWVIVCVRGEQLTAALQELVASMGAQRRIAIATISLAGVIEQARRSGLHAEIYALHVSFGAYAVSSSRADSRASTAHEPPLYRWFPFAPPSLVTPDGERAQLGQARALATALSRAGLWTRASLSVTAPMRALAALITVFTLGWELCGWEIQALARQAALRAETASAMHEALRLVAPTRSPLRLVPRFAIALLLRFLPWFMSTRARELWRSHGPKIRAQNEQVTRELLALSERKGMPVPALRELFEKWQRGGD